MSQKMSPSSMSSCPLYCNFSNDRSLLTLLTYTLTSHRSYFFFFFFKRDCILFKRSWQTFFYKADFFCEAQRDGESHCESHLKKDTSKIFSKFICRIPMKCLMGQNNMICRRIFFYLMISPSKQIPIALHEKSFIFFCL